MLQCREGQNTPKRRRRLQVTRRGQTSSGQSMPSRHDALADIKLVFQNLKLQPKVASLDAELVEVRIFFSNLRGPKDVNIMCDKIRVSAKKLLGSG